MPAPFRQIISFFVTPYAQLWDWLHEEAIPEPGAKEKGAEHA